jgi:hypothetical protein
MTVIEQLRTLYFNATQSSIGDDFGTAIDLFKQLTNDEDREKAAVFMEGIAEMRREWGADGRGAGTKPKHKGPTNNTGKPADRKRGSTR